MNCRCIIQVSTFEIYTLAPNEANPNLIGFTLVQKTTHFIFLLIILHTILMKSSLKLLLIGNEGTFLLALMHLGIISCFHVVSLLRNKRTPVFSTINIF